MSTHTPTPSAAAPRPPANLILMGLRGSGKSTLGSLVAARLARPFIDLDDRVMARLGFETVARAWDAVGEPAFRIAEASELRAVLDEHPHGLVLALGGGTPTAPGAADALRAHAAAGAALVYLRCTPAELRARLSRPAAGAGEAAAGVHSAGPNRPSLTGRDPLDEIEEVFQRRDPLYRGLATRVLESPASAHAAVEALTGAG